MPVRQAECAWAPCELLTPRQYVYVKIANRCMVPWCTQDPTTINDLPMDLPRDRGTQNLFGGPFSSLTAVGVLGLTHGY